MVTTTMSSQSTLRVARALSHSVPLAALSGSTSAIVPSARTFRNARSRKSAASPMLPVPSGWAPLSVLSEACIRSRVGWSVSKAANAELPLPSLSASIPVDRTKGGFMMTRSNLPCPTLETKSRTCSGARPPADTAAAVSINVCWTVSANKSNDPIATRPFSCSPKGIVRRHSPSNGVSGWLPANIAAVKWTAMFSTSSPTSPCRIMGP